ncbi:hypothetical protein H6504_00620 [Candidatus Woesearchaeota archaeon]|nr:hypothetical protein [Candidatus Woesearchaeota archaeon]
MKVEVLNTKDAPLLKRKEVELKVTFEGATPSKVELAPEIAKVAKTQVPNIVIKTIRNSYGEQEAKISVYAYETPEALKEIESKVPDYNKKEENAEA